MVPRITYPEPESPCCWVYILRQRGGKLSIRYCLDLPAEVSSLDAHTRLLSYRNFSSVMEAIAYKLYLENISVETIDILISAENPYWIDLRKKLIKGK